MADSTRRAELTAKLLRLQIQQQESWIDATYLGWTLESRHAHEERADFVKFLMRELTVVE